MIKKIVEAYKHKKSIKSVYTKLLKTNNFNKQQIKQSLKVEKIIRKYKLHDVFKVEWCNPNKNVIERTFESK